MNPITWSLILILTIIRLILVTGMSLIVTGLTLVIAPFWAIYRVFKPKKWKYDPNRE